MSATKMLSFRVDEAMHERIVEAHQRMGLDRSAYCRLALSHALGDSVHEAILANELLRLRPAIAEIFATLSAEAIESAVGKVDERMREVLAKRLGTEP